ncbi:MAG: hypothetical protein L0H55_15765, partial [Candidatus Nitrosocosmicus sp.]|nr:hypothetical protein [Candidatus Nitrosocosmicus sp.]
VKDFVNDLCVYYNDEQLDQRIRVVDDTYQKWVTGQEVTGISHLYEIFEKMLDSKRDAVRLINSLSNIIGDSKVHSLFQNSQTELPDNIREELSNHVYKITSIGSSKKVIIAHTGLKQTVTGFINKINKKEKKQDDTDNSSNKNEDIFKYELNFGDILIDAIPTKIIIYDNPIDKSHNYEITFSTISEKKPLKIGPGSLEYIINELQLRNKILKKSNIHDAISAIISAFIETEKAIIHDNVVNPGYYFLDGTFIASDTNQSFIHISISPPPTSKPVLQGSSLVDVNNVNAYSEIDKDTKEKIYSCIQLLDELDSKWPKGFFSTVIKWALISPFSFILKQNRRWMPYLFLYGYSRSGKNTLGCISLAIWKKYEKSRRKENNYEIGFGKINSEARLGHVLSMDTYPRLVNEVGVLTEPKNLNLIEMIKSAVENQDVRGIMVNYRNYTSISALSPLILTSNRSPPPDDSGFMRRIISLYFDKFSSKTREEAKVFEKWLDPQMDKFGILGDFAYSYIKEKPGLLNGDLEWGVIAKDILVSFYSAVRKNPPAWIEDMIENNTLEENKDNTTIEFRAFLINETNEHYNKYIRNFSNTLTSNQTSTGYVVTNSEFTDRLEFCLDNGVIPYMVNHTYKNGEEKVCITT